MGISGVEPDLTYNIAKSLEDQRLTRALAIRFSCHSLSYSISDSTLPLSSAPAALIVTSSLSVFLKVSAYKQLLLNHGSYYS